LCLLMVAALHWIIGSAEALATTEQNEAVLSTPDLTQEVVNTGLKASLVAAGLRAEETLLGLSTSRCGQRLMLVRIQPNNQRDPLPIESTSGVRIHRDRGRQDDRK